MSVPSKANIFKLDNPARPKTNHQAGVDKDNLYISENSTSMDGRPHGYGGEPFLADSVTVPGAVIDGFFGVKRTWDLLEAHPSLPAGWKSDKAQVIWKGQKYNITAHSDVLATTEQVTN
jgi:cellobiose phosphorylase